MTGRQLRLLLVEDSDDDAELVLGALRRGGMDPICERVQTREAMAAALESGRQWDVVVSDYTMARFSALAAFELLTQRGIDVPFIIVSGTVGEEIAVHALKLGAHDFMLKANLTRLVP